MIMKKPLVANDQRLFSLDLGRNHNFTIVAPRILFLMWFASCGTDPLVHHGRHFGRVVHALCTVTTLLNNGILRMGEFADRAEETFTQEYVMWSISLF